MNSHIILEPINNVLNISISYLTEKKIKLVRIILLADGNMLKCFEHQKL